MRLRTVLVPVVCWVVGVASASAQPAQPAAPPKTVTLAASAGLALTSGNTDTRTFNAAYDFVYDPHRRNLVKSDALLIRGVNEGELSADRLGFNVRDEFKLRPRVVVFGQNQFLHDSFKNIDYLVAPTGGIGYALIDSDRTKLNVDGGLGGVWEKNPDTDVSASGALVAGEKFSENLTPTATLTQSFSGLWKTNDMDDALYTFGVGIAATMSSRTQLKVEVLDTFKNKPPVASIQKNDVAVLMAIVFKM